MKNETKEYIRVSLADIYSKERTFGEWMKFIFYSVGIKNPSIIAGALASLTLPEFTETVLLDLVGQNVELVNPDLFTQIVAVNLGLLILADMSNFKAEDALGKIVNGVITSTAVAVLFLAQIPFMPEPNTAAQAELASKLLPSMATLLLSSFGIRAIVAPLIEKITRMVTYRKEIYYPNGMYGEGGLLQEYNEGDVPHYHEEGGNCDGNCVPRGWSSNLLGVKRWVCEGGSGGWHNQEGVTTEGEDGFMNADEAEIHHGRGNLLKNENL